MHIKHIKHLDGRNLKQVPLCWLLCICIWSLLGYNLSITSRQHSSVDINDGLDAFSNLDKTEDLIRIVA